MSNAMVLRPQTMGELQDFADIAARSSMVPKDYQGKPENVLIAVQMGSEVGLAPMQALQNIAVINGRPAIWGDAMPGLCRQSPLCEDIEESFEGEGDKLTAVCVAKRVGKKPIVQRFSVDDAKKAGLWGKNIWQQYPKRMLQQRARGFALRDAFPDVLRGLISAEEAMDIPARDTFAGPTIEHEPEKPAAAPPQDARDRLNAEVPMRAAAAPMHRQHKVAAYDADPLEETNISKWLLNLETLLSNAASQDEVVTIAGHHTVGTASAKAPPAIRNRVSEMLAKAYGRFATDEPAEEPELFADAIPGEEKLGAG